MQKNALKMTLISLLAIGLLLLSAGCQLQPQARPETPETSAPAPSILELPNNSEASEKGNASLFNSIFVPMAQGKLGANLAALQEAAAQYGYKYISEAGVVVLLDSAQPDCSIRAEPAGSDPSAKINRLVYLRHIGDYTRQAAITNLDEKTPLFYIQSHVLQEETQVFSLEDVKTYLHAEISPEETAEGAAETAQGLFENILVPLAEGSLLNRAKEFKGALEQYGYIYKESEGQFTVYDPEHPKNYLFGANALWQDTDTIFTLGFYLTTETGAKQVEVYFSTDKPKYYIININEAFSQTEVESFAQIKEYIAQD